MQKLSSFGRGKKFRPKKSLTVYELVARSPSIVTQPTVCEKVNIT